MGRKELNQTNKQIQSHNALLDSKPIIDIQCMCGQLTKPMWYFASGEILFLPSVSNKGVDQTAL